jgi:hypothetical protein
VDGKGAGEEMSNQPDVNLALDLAMMIRRLVARLQKHEPESLMCKQAILLLEKHGIKSWPLR